MFKGFRDSRDYRTLGWGGQGEGNVVETRLRGFGRVKEFWFCFKYSGKLIKLDLLDVYFEDVLVEEWRIDQLGLERIDKSGRVDGFLILKEMEEVANLRNI